MTAAPGRPAPMTGPPRIPRARPVLYVLMVNALLVAIAMAVRALLDPLSGVTGTIAAWLVTASTLLLLGAVLVGGLLHIRGGFRGVLLFLVALGAVGTFLASWLMMQWVLLFSMVAFAILYIAWLFSRRPEVPERVSGAEVRA